MLTGGGGDKLGLRLFNANNGSWVSIIFDMFEGNSKFGSAASVCTHTHTHTCMEQCSLLFCLCVFCVDMQCVCDMHVLALSGVYVPYTLHMRGVRRMRRIRDIIRVSRCYVCRCHHHLWLCLPMRDMVQNVVDLHHVFGTSSSFYSVLFFLLSLTLNVSSFS